MVDSAAAVQAKAYFTSKENQLLVPNSDFGRRKFVNVQTSTPSRAGFQGPNQTAVQSYSRFQKQEQQEDPDVDYTDLDMKKSGTRQWIHPPDTLLKGHIVYNVKFLGHVEVESPKGTEVVRDAIRKMKFNKQIKKAEGHKPKKVELTVSIDGVTVQGIKTKEVYHQYPLHRISYCADDKADKRMFTFIAKEADTPGHHCFVFDSDKCAEEITLTVGQAFDLAYRRFLDSSSKDMDVKKQYLLCQKQVQELTTENLALKSRVAMLERLVDPSTPGYHDTSKPVLQRSTSREQPVVGRRLENLVLEDSEPPAFPQPVVNGNHAVPALAPPPHVPTRNNVPVLPTMQPQSQQPSRDMFGAEPFTPPAVSAVPRRPSAGPDPFGMGEFSPSPQSLDQQIQKVDSELMDLQSGFSRGLAFGTEDFSIEDLDPLSKK